MLMNNIKIIQRNNINNQKHLFPLKPSFLGLTPNNLKLMLYLVQIESRSLNVKIKSSLI